MITEKTSLLIPVENQVRELDAKLLLSCIAATRGYPCVIGPRARLHARIAAFSPSIYLAKGMSGRSALLFKIVRRSGHEIVTWDEEALVHLPPAIYFSRRISPEAIRYVSHLFAWGEDNAELWRRYADLPEGMPIHVTGNPRVDLLRHDLCAFFDQEVRQICESYGDFILLNTNFNHVNAYYPYMNLFQPANKPGDMPQFGEAAKGMTREYAEGLRNLKLGVLADFKALMPALEEAFPQCTIVVRPHPTENQNTYREIAERCTRVRVTNEGNVVPWLMATKALVHNGCTTGVEAYLLGVPAISYRATVDESYDFGFYRLPNTLSHSCHSFEELRATIAGILAGDIGVVEGSKEKKMVARYLMAQDGPLACERIVDVIEAIVRGWANARTVSLRNRLERWGLASGLSLIRMIDPYLPRSHNRPEFHRHRYPGISLDEVRARLGRFQRLLGLSAELRVEELFDEVYRIAA